MEGDPLILMRMILEGYLLTIAFETPVLVWGLGKRYSLKSKFFCGFFLTACSYPFVTLVFPRLIDPYAHWTAYIVVAEVFAAVSECVVFALLMHRGTTKSRCLRRLDYAVVVAANLFSFACGELMKSAGFHFQ